MSIRDTYPPSEIVYQRDIRIHKDFAEPRDTTAPTATNSHENINALSPTTSNTMNTLNGVSGPSKGFSTIPKASNGTIRSVPNESLHVETAMASTNENTRPPLGKNDSTLVSSSKPYFTSPSQPPSIWQNNLPVSAGLVRSISSEFGPTKNYAGNNTRALEDNGPSSGLSSPDSQIWSSAVGRANLGKSGRVIERLMGENDMLKRDLQIEKLRAADSSQAVKMIESRMEAMAAEFEAKLHDATINSTLLKRRERQLAEVKAQVDGEKLKAAKALEREQGWKDAYDKLDEDCKRKVEEAQRYAAMMEGRNNTLTNHWKDQGREVDQAVAKIGQEIEAVVTERREDDKKILKLQIISEQQGRQILALRKQNEALQKKHDQYKAEQEEGLKLIKVNAMAADERIESVLEESRGVLHNLKWALAVQVNVNNK